MATPNEAEPARQTTPAEFAPVTIHFTQLAPLKPDDQRYREWETYRREVARLIEEGNGGKAALIKDDAIVGLFDSLEAALAEGYRRYLLEGFLVQEIREWEPILRIRGFNLPWRACWVHDTV